ncbi:unnamed protein product [Effrenium voratum]|nr:unnamed protein product [Effrenium voratum]
MSGDGVESIFRHPLAVTYPSPLLLLNYPLIVSNVKMLNEKGVRPKSTLVGTIRMLRDTHSAEGIIGLYKGGHLYLLHQALRDFLRLVAERGLGAIERRLSCEARPKAQYLGRLAVKYCIDGLCYPVLLASSRSIVKSDQENSWQSLQMWSREEGIWSLFAGLTASLVSTAIEEAMEMLLTYCMERYARTTVDAADKLVLKACGSSVVSVFTSPVNYVGIIQRCQSHLPTLPERRSFAEIIHGLPWRGWRRINTETPGDGSFNSLVLYGGILTLNVRLIQWKMQLQEEDE